MMNYNFNDLRQLVGLKVAHIAHSATPHVIGIHPLREVEAAVKIRYNDFWVRLLAAVISGALIVSAGEDESLFELLAISHAYIALVSSMVMALFVLEVLFRMNRWLDCKLQWFVQFLKRMLLQLLLCVLLPLMVALACATIYYGFFHYSLSQTSYFDRQFMPIVIMVISANLYYMLQYTVRLLKLSQGERKQEQLRLATQLAENNMVAPMQTEALLHLNSDTDESVSSPAEKMYIPKDINLKQISCIYTRDRLVWAHYQGVEIDWPLNIKDSIATLSEADYFCISKSCIVRRGNIAKAYHLLPRRAALVLHTPLHKIVTVAKNRKTRFTKWYGKTIFAARPKNHNTDLFQGN